MVYIILGAGFEESEAIVPCDLLRRAGIETQFAGIGGREIIGSHGIPVVADCVAEDAPLAQAEMLVLPGGLRGVQSIRGSRPVLEAVRAAYQSGRFVAAICAAPTILAELGITDGKMAVCYPGMEEQMGAAVMQHAGTMRDDTVITGRAAGASFDFGLALVAALRGEEAAKKVAGAVVYQA